MFKNIVGFIRNNTTETIVLVLSGVLIIFGLVTLMPAEWLGITTSYPSQWARTIAGLLIMIAPTVPVMYGVNTNRGYCPKWLFWMAIV